MLPTSSPDGAPSTLNSAGLSSYRQLFVFAVMLPASVVAANQFLIATLPGESLRTWLYPTMALSVAVLSWCAGRYLKPPWLSWIIFAWSLALLDLLTMAMCFGGRTNYQFKYVMVAAQTSLVVLWTILGASPWQWRLPILLVATPFIIAFAGFLPDPFRGLSAPSWAILLVTSTSVVAALCASLRLAAFKMQIACNANGASDERQFQFGLRHMLIWSTAMVPLLLVGRGLDFFVFKRIGTNGTVPIMLFAMCLALVSLTAIWAVLGRGAWMLRLATLALVPALFAGIMHLTMLYLHALRGNWNWWQSLDNPLLGLRSNWPSWFYMNAFLLSALLLFFRAKGYQFVKRVRSE